MLIFSLKLSCIIQHEILNGAEISKILKISGQPSSLSNPSSGTWFLRSPSFWDYETGVQEDNLEDFQGKTAAAHILNLKEKSKPSKYLDNNPQSAHAGIS